MRFLSFIKKPAPKKKVPQQRQRQGRKAGFALLEVMCATAIFAIAMVGLSGALNTMIGSATAVERESRVREQLEWYAATLRSRKLEIGKQDLGSTDGVTYSSQVEPLLLKTDQGDPLNSLYRLTLIAVWRESSGPNRRSAEFYVYAP